YFFFFFFQAEDGIRDRNVTGVQTCAFPISSMHFCSTSGIGIQHIIIMDKRLEIYELSQTTVFALRTNQPFTSCPRACQSAPNLRSEERRVGKECRTRR